MRSGMIKQMLDTGKRASGASVVGQLASMVLAVDTSAESISAAVGHMVYSRLACPFFHDAVFLNPKP